MPDTRKGERIMLFTNQQDADSERVHGVVQGAMARANIAVPKKIVPVEEISAAWAPARQITSRSAAWRRIWLRGQRRLSSGRPR